MPALGIKPTGPFGIRTDKTYSAESAQALVAGIIANPIPVINGILDPSSSWIRRIIPGKPGYHVEDPRIEDQQSKPERPETRFYTTDSYGKIIPISMGRRRVTGTVIQSSALEPRLVGNKTYTIKYEIPIYEDPPVDPDGGFSITLDDDTRTRDEPGGTSCGGADACDTRGGFLDGGGSDGGDGNPYYLLGCIECLGACPSTVTPATGTEYATEDAAIAAANALSDSARGCVYNSAGHIVYSKLIE